MAQSQASMFYTGGNIAAGVNTTAEKAYSFFYDPDDSLWHPLHAS